jgi:AICAR transformylase/IMP cyclohydrolase PurH
VIRKQVELDNVALALGAPELERIDAVQVALARADALSRNERPVLAVLARDAQRLMGFPDVVKVRGWRDHLRLALPLIGDYSRT